METTASKLAALTAEHGSLLTGVEAAAFLGVCFQRVSELATKGTIRRFPVGQSRYYPLADLQAWADRRKRGGPRGRGHIAPPVFEVAA